MKINNELYRTLVLTILAGLSIVVMALANRDVYSKEVIDTKIESIESDVLYMQEDVRWLVRQQGGTPSAEAGKDNHTSQPD